MSTLAELNNTLGVVAANTAKTGNAVDKLTAYFKGSAGDKLEQQREQKRSSSTGGFMNMFSRSGNKSKGKSGGGFGLGLGAMIPAFTLAGMGKGLLKTLPPLIIATLADEIVDNFIDPNGKLSPEARDLMIGGIEVGSLAALFGKRFIPLGIALGVLKEGIDDDTKNRALTAATSAVERIGRVLFGTTIGSGDSAQKTEGLLGSGGFFNTFAEGLNGIADLLEGDFSGFGENFKEAMAVIGGALVIMSPLSPFRLFLGGFGGKGKKGFFYNAIKKLGMAAVGGAALNTLFNDPFFDGFRDMNETEGGEQIIPDSVILLAQAMGGYALIRGGEYVIVRSGQILFKGTASMAKTAYQKMTGKTPTPKTPNTKPGTNTKSLSDSARKMLSPDANKDFAKLKEFAKTQGYEIDSKGQLKSGGKYISNAEAEDFAQKAQKALGNKFKIGISGAAKIAGKFALRFIPFVGWVMLASDAYALANYVASDDELANEDGLRRVSDINKMLNDKTMGVNYAGLDNQLISEMNTLEKTHPELFNKLYGSTGIATQVRNRSVGSHPSAGVNYSKPSTVTSSEDSMFNEDGLRKDIEPNVNIGQIGSNSQVQNINPLAMMDFGGGDRWNTNTRGLHSTSMY